MTLQELQTEYDNYIVYAKQFAKLNAEYNQKAIIAQQEYDNNCSNIAQSVKEFEDSIVMQRETARKEQEADLLNQKRLIGDMLKKTTSPDTKNSLLKMLDAVQLAHDITMKKIDEIDLENKNDLASKPEQLKQVIEADFQSKKESIVSEFEKIYNDYIYLQNKLFASRYETASSSNIFFWDKMPESDHMPITYTTYAISKLNCSLFGKVYSSEIYHIAPFINRNNIIITCDSTSKQLAQQLANAIVLKNTCAMPKNLKLNLVDTFGLTSNLGELRRLDPKTYDRFITDKHEVQSTLNYLNNNIRNITQKISGALPTLHDFNNKANVRQNNHLLYFSDFVFDVEDRDISTIDTIVRNGPRAGVNSIFVINKDQVELKNDREDKYRNNIDNLKKYAFEIDINSHTLPQEFNLSSDNIFWETEERFDVDKLLNRIEKSLKAQTGKVISLRDYLLPKEQWWKKDNINGIETQIGVLVEENNKPFNLKLSLEADNFSGIISGTPRQGKSSLYHTFICNAITEYSPAELQFYLVDLKGVEFEMYARDSIYTPHISVVASNSEREFALNVIEELILEGKARAEKYAKVGANGLWSYNSKVSPEEKDPIKILMIDEFIQLFSVNDKITESAYNALMRIIQVNSAFGIIMLTALQTLKTGQISLTNMLNLVPLRFVFKSSDDDNMQLLNQSISKRESILNRINFPGQFIANNNFGSESPMKKNQLVQTLFINDKERESLLTEISDFSKQYLQRTYSTRVYDLSKPSKMEDNIKLSDLTLMRKTQELEIFVGKAMSLASDDVYLSLKNESGSNLLVLGGENDNVPTRIMVNSILGIMFNLKPSEVEFCVINGINQGDDDYSVFNDYFLDSEFSFEMVSYQDVFSTIRNVKQEILDLIEENKRRDKHKILIFLQTDRINFGFDDDLISMMRRDMEIILNNGPLLGFHTLIQCRDSQKFDDIFDRYSTKYFKHKIALQMSSNQAYSFVGDDRASNITEDNKEWTKNFGYYYLSGSTSVLKFNAYDFPNPTWVQKKIIC